MRHMSEEEKAAKLASLEELREMLMREMSEAPSSIQVLAEDEEGLKEGLDAAQEIMEEGPESLIEDQMAAVDEMYPEEEGVEELGVELEAALLDDSELPDYDTADEQEDILEGKTEEELIDLMEKIKARL